jgi:4a-hydroxytetrahydrobiopterin dehydratase
MAELLSDEDLKAALADLPEWEGDRGSIRRTVRLDEEARQTLLSELEAVAREMNHDPDLEFPDGAVAITMSTHSKGGVTDLDVTYARRADEVISRLLG